MLHYSDQPEDEDATEAPTERNFRMRTFSVSEGISTGNTPPSYTALSFDNWYYLALNVIYDREQDVYSFTAGLYQATAAGEIGPQLFEQGMSDLSIPELSAAESNWLWVGLPGGRAGTRGVAALDQFVTSIPEPSHYALFFGAALLLGLSLRRLRK